MYGHRDGRFTRIALSLFFVCILGYAAYEAQAMLLGPVVTTLPQPEVLNKAFVTIRGQADHIASLSMNGKPIAVTEEGAFEEPYVLMPGLNYIVFDAVDKYGRARQKVLEMVYRSEGDTGGAAQGSEREENGENEADNETEPSADEMRTDSPASTTATGTQEAI